MSDDAARLEATVHGHVQGVGFRGYTMQKAMQLGVTGWVKNLPNRTVRVVAEGTRPQLEALLAHLKDGIRTAKVTHIDAAWHEATGEFDRFAVDISP